MGYNPASLRVKEQSPSAVDLTGVVTLVLPPDAVVDLGRGAVLINLGPALAGAAIYRLSTTLGDGTISTFPFTQPIRSLIFATIDGQIQDPSQVSVDGAGRLVLGIGITPPGDANLGSKVGAYYAPVI